MFVCFLPSFPQIKLPGADVRFRRIFASASLRTGIRYSKLGIPNNFYDCSRKGIDSLNRVFYSACRKTSLCNATFPGRAGEANFTGGDLGTQKADGEAGQGAQVSSRHLGSQVPNVRDGPAEHGGDRAGTIVGPLLRRV
jgi:hypothetical protein